MEELTRVTGLEVVGTIRFENNKIMVCVPIPKVDVHDKDILMSMGYNLSQDETLIYLPSGYMAIKGHDKIMIVNTHQQVELEISSNDISINSITRIIVTNISEKSVKLELKINDMIYELMKCETFLPSYFIQAYINNRMLPTLILLDMVCVNTINICITEQMIQMIKIECCNKMNDIKKEYK